MTAATPDRYCDLIEQRIALLSSLAEALAAARADIVSFDIASLEQRISEQDRLCTRIRAVDSELDRLQDHCAKVLAIGAQASSNPAPQTHRLRDLASRLNAVQSTVKQLNDSHQMLLRRSRRTASALLSSYQSFAETYSDPSAARVSVGERA